MGSPDAELVIVGRNGIGKTTTLASLQGAAAQSEPERDLAVCEHASSYLVDRP